MTSQSLSQLVVVLCVSVSGSPSPDESVIVSAGGAVCFSEWLTQS